jgi:SulP family sulfate permease
MALTSESKAISASIWMRFLPISSWLKTYNREDLNGDLIAGVITAILLVPQAIAYAMLAGLPPQLGLYASILPPAVYALFGTSRTMSVGPVSVGAIMIASALAAPEISQLGSPVESAVILALEGGFILLLMAILRMGGLVNFISHPVLTGFTSGAAILIIFSQLPQLLGMGKPQCGLDMSCYINYAQHYNSVTLCIGLLSIVVLFFFSKPLTFLLTKSGVADSIVMAISKSGPLLVVVLGTVLVSKMGFNETHSVKVIGFVPAGLPDFNLDFGLSDKWKLLLPYSGFIALIAYIESVAIAKVTANMRNQRIDANQELVALGAANLAAAVSGGMSVAGGFSRTMVNFSAGARTQMAMIIAVGILSLAVIFFTDWFEIIPKVTLAAIIIIAILPLVKLRNITNTWTYDRADGIAELATLLGVLFFGIEEGLVLGIILTIAGYLRKTSQPHIAVVGRVANTEHYRNVDRHQVQTWDNLLLLRVDENITFSNVGYIEDFLMAELAKHDTVKHVIFIFTSVSYIDATGFEALENLNRTLKVSEIALHLAEVKGPVMDKLVKTDILEQLKPGQVFFRVEEAVNTLANVKLINTEYTPDEAS